MPMKVRWNSKEYKGIALMLLGGCGFFQIIFIFIAQYYFSIGNYLVITLIPAGVILALFFGSTIIFESFAQVERRERLRSQYKKSKGKKRLRRRFLELPITRPLLILFVVFSGFFFPTYFICVTFLNNINSFIIAETLSAVVCLLVANGIEKKFGKVRRI